MSTYYRPGATDSDIVAVHVEYPDAGSDDYTATVEVGGVPVFRQTVPVPVEYGDDTWDPVAVAGQTVLAMFGRSLARLLADDSEPVER